VTTDNTPNTALAPLTSSADLLALNDIGDPGDGYSHAIDPGEIRVPRKIFNMKGLDKRGKAIPKDVYYDTDTETMSETVNAIFVYAHGWNAWTEYSEADDRTTTHCISDDRVTGHYRERDELRKCLGCPDAQWRTDSKGKAHKNCSKRFTVLAVDVSTYTPFLLSYKKTSLNTWLGHTAKHHNAKLRLPSGGKANVKLHSYVVTLGLRMATNGLYSVPIISDPIRMATPDEARDCDETRVALHSTIVRAARAETDDTSFDTGDM